MKQLPVRFYRTLHGAEPVRDWLRGLEVPARRAIGFDLKLVELGWPVGMPLCRSLGRGLWELRSDLPDGRAARLIFCVQEGVAVVLHGFIKKSQKTPLREIEVALRRKRDVDG
jgi:phage-related protein